MMKCVCSVFDTQAKFFGNPFYMTTKGEAVRGFSDAVNDSAPQNLMHKHPGDFILYVIGMFDDSKGELVSIVPPERLALGSDFVREVSQ